MSINGGSYITGTATVANADTISVRVTSGNILNGAIRSAILTVAGVTDTYSVTNSGSFGGGGM